MYKIIPAFLLTLAIGACKKPLSDVNDYFPKITLKSATIKTDGTSNVLVEASIESEGAAPVTHSGFSCSTNNNPVLLDRQILADYDPNGQFSAGYAGNFLPKTTYYFRAWAVNEYGYSYSNVIAVNNVITPIKPPCSQSNYNFVLNTGWDPEGFSPVPAPSKATGPAAFTANGAFGTSFNFSFGSTITTGIYTTATANPKAGEVRIGFQGLASGVLSSGSKVYVNTISKGVFTIAVCSAPWTYKNGSTYYCTGLIQTPS